MSNFTAMLFSTESILPLFASVFIFAFVLIGVTILIEKVTR